MTTTIATTAPASAPVLVEPPAYDVDPGELEQPRPFDADACTLCQGDGCYEVRSPIHGGEPVYVTCPTCGGDGERRWTA